MLGCLLGMHYIKLEANSIFWTSHLSMTGYNIDVEGGSPAPSISPALLSRKLKTLQGPSGSSSQWWRLHVCHAQKVGAQYPHSSQPPTTPRPLLNSWNLTWLCGPVHHSNFSLHQLNFRKNKLRDWICAKTHIYIAWADKHNQPRRLQGVNSDHDSGA